jgi:EAL domain-containing protein (putative c-di-GMP-specific phosphodiesterase class I)
MAQATTQAAALQDAMGRPVKVTVNVSAKQLDTDVVAMVAAALAHSGLPADHLTLEITETFLASHQDGAVAKLEALRHLGVRIAIDDFGTGYSSLEYLKRLPIDTLKIDRAFTRSVTDGVEGAALAHAIIKLADTFGLRTIAEGIETEEQAEVVRGFGCGFGQGNLFARPVPIEELLATFTCVKRRNPVSA